MRNYDVIIIGAGSVGIPTALALGDAGAKVLVIDAKPSPGQGENKHAIGGIRATHSTRGKILCGLRSLEIFSTWQTLYGDDIEWLQGGYLFPVYREIEETALKSILPIQKKHGLEIEFVGPDAVAAQMPGIVTRGLKGGTFSPKDGSASPLLAINAFYRQALARGAVFRFKEKIQKILTNGGRVTGVVTDRGDYTAPVVVDAAGAYSQPLGQTAGIDIPVIPDSHEGAITEPVQPFFKCMVVDLRPGTGPQNYYFYQNRHGQVVFCITPDPPIIGTDHRETSIFLPQVCKRMVSFVPRLQNVRVRRVWRGLYPMSPDGAPLVGWNSSVEGFFHVTGMCGQGYMLGPGIGEVAARAITGTGRADDDVILKEFSLERQFGGGEEALK